MNQADPPPAGGNGSAVALPAHAVAGPSQDKTFIDISGSALGVAWILLSFASAFSWFGESRDHIEYLRYYESIPQSLALADTRFEPGFHIAAWFFRNTLNLEFEYFLLFLASTALAIKFYLFRRHLAHPLLAAVTYVMVFYFTQEYTQIRAAVGLALGYAAIHLFVDKRYLLGGLLMVLGFAFHGSTVLLLFAYIGARTVRGNVATVLIGAGVILIYVLSDSIRTFAVETFSGYNPLLRSYMENRAAIEDLSIFSVNNLILALAVVSAIALGWFRLSRYHAVFLTMLAASLVMLVLFAEAPMVGQRSKEVLFVSAIFLMYRAPISEKTIIPVLFLWADALLLFYLSLREGLITL